MEPNGPVLVIDNYDSFTYNLVQYLGELGERVMVRRNDEISLPAIAQLDPLAGVQFHPEAILTEHGHQLLANFLGDARAWWNSSRRHGV